MPENSEILAIIGEEDLPDIPIKIEVTDEKPFNECLLCQYLGHGCSGPNVSAMSLGRACEFFQLRRIQLGYSYQKLADLSGLSLITVKRILKGQVKDPGHLSMQALSNALTKDPTGKYPCALHLQNQEAERNLAADKATQEALDRKEREHDLILAAERRQKEFLLEQVKFKEDQMVKKDSTIEKRDKEIEDLYEFIRRKNRIIANLVSLAATLAAIIIGALALDRSNPNIGFFWIDQAADPGKFFGIAIAAAIICFVAVRIIRNFLEKKKHPPVK